MNSTLFEFCSKCGGKSVENKEDGCSKPQCSGCGFVSCQNSKYGGKKERVIPPQPVWTRRKDGAVTQPVFFEGSEGRGVCGSFFFAGKYYNYEMMNIKLCIRRGNCMKLCLVLGKKEINCLAWRDKNDLSRSLLANLDKLLQKSGCGVDKISGYKIMSDVPRKWTSCRIAEITFKALGLAKKNNL